MNPIDDATLLKMAEAEILGEAKRAAVRYSLSGVAGWQPCPKPNKLFLTNTLLHTMASNRLLSKKKENIKGSGSKHEKRERKLLQKSNKSEKTNIIYKKPQKKVEVGHKSANSSESKKDKIRQKINYIKKSSKDRDNHKH